VRNVGILEEAARLLGPLSAEVVFLGGSAVGLWISDPGAPDPRPSRDVDVVIEVVGLSAYYQFGERLRKRGFNEDMDSGVICRWKHEHGLLLDVMPTDDSILGFSNPWYAPAIAHAMVVTLPNGQDIRAAAPPFLMATKLEAFNNRGRGDYLGSRDFQDLVALVDGRPELVSEVSKAPEQSRAYIAREIHRLMDDPYMTDGIAGSLRPDAGSQGRIAVIQERLSLLAVAG
jgi:Nucleotidyl transferase AbiEii toxin, Type IV TA system